MMLLLLIHLLVNPIVNLEQIGTIYFLNNYFMYNISIAYIQIFLIIVLISFLILFSFFFKYYLTSIFEYIFLILCAFFSLQIMILCNNLFLLFLFLEVVNLCLYCLLGLNKNSNFGIEIAYKYFIQSAYTTLIGFFALSIFYFILGTLDLNELHVLIDITNISYIVYSALLFLILNLFFKLGMFPLHSWLSDVYQASFLLTALFIATIPKIVYIVIFFKFLVIFHDFISYITLFLSFCTIIYGSLITLYQTNIKRILGYGSMVHIGFIIYSMSLYTLDSLSAAFFYLIIYIILIYFFFSFFFFVFENINASEMFFIENISQLNLLLNKNKLITIMIIFILFSFAGLPLFLGFFAKWSIFLNLLLTHKYIELSCFLIFSLISTIYYIRLLRFIFFLEWKKYQIIMYINYKNFQQLRFFLIFVIALFIINIFIMFYYTSIYLYIWKYIYLFIK